MCGCVCVRGREGGEGGGADCGLEGDCTLRVLHAGGELYVRSLAGARRLQLTAGAMGAAVTTGAGANRSFLARTATTAWANASSPPRANPGRSPRALAVGCSTGQCLEDKRELVWYR